MRKVFCKKLGKELEGLEKPPFKGDIGTKIYENISKQAWESWKEMQLKIINEYRLNMSDPKDYQALISQMLRFLNLEEGQVSEVENATRGKQS